MSKLRIPISKPKPDIERFLNSMSGKKVLEKPPMIEYLPAVSLITKDTAKGYGDHNRAWQGLHDGPIKDWNDFEGYPWPEINDDNFYIHRYICEHLPEGFGFITCHAGGVYEHVSRLMGYEGLCYNFSTIRNW